MILRYLIIIAASLAFILVELISEQVRIRINASSSGNELIKHDIKRIENTSNFDEAETIDQLYAAKKVSKKKVISNFEKEISSPLRFKICDSYSENSLEQVKIRGRLTVFDKENNENVLRQIIINETTDQAGIIEDYHKGFNFPAKLELVMFKKGYETKMEEFLFDENNMNSNISLNMKKIS